MQEKVNPETKSEAESITQLIVFRAGNEEFAVSISAVREIIKMGPITPIPNSSLFIQGIINVRGEIVTVIDVKARFSLQDEKKIKPKHIIVTEQEDNLLGLMVDEVIEILRINKIEIHHPPTLLTQIEEEYIEGVVNHEDRLIMVLNLRKMLSQKELVKLTHIIKKQDKEKPLLQRKKI